MAVTFDNFQTRDDFGVTSLTTLAFTIGSGANRVAIVGLGAFANTSAETATCGGVSGTKVSSTDNFLTGIQVMLFAMINPASGSQTASCSWTTAASCTVAALTFAGADQTTPATNGVTKGTAFSTTNSQAITSVSGDMTVTFNADGAGDGAETSNQTKKSTGQCGCFDIGPGTGTTTHTWSHAAVDMLLAGLNVAQAGAGGSALYLVRPQRRPFMFKPGSSQR